MGRSDLEELRKAAAKVAAKNAKSKAAVRRFLQAEGLVDKQGKLTKAYAPKAAAA